LQEGEELEVDNSTYEMLHRMNVEWPILSFDFMRDGLGQQRTKVYYRTAALPTFNPSSTQSQSYEPAPLPNAFC
jgi:hypothetical protein